MTAPAPDHATGPDRSSGGAAAGVAAHTPGTGSSKPTVIRADIQALRAVAVTLVLLYHLWPNRLSGGYIGVDVFFVISGYLITAHLLLKPPRSVTNLLRFWGRRIRRLLPASLLVLLTTLIATRLIAPSTMWESGASHIRAAALYFVNWRLAADAVDYLAQDEEATAVEHFWSLSVEEQFYLIWPVLIVLLGAIAVMLRRRAIAVTVAGLGVVVASSLIYSVYLTEADSAAAYFVTPTRIWELGIGGMAAALLVSGALGRVRPAGDAIALPAGARTALVWIGFAAIGWAALTYTDATPFPGWHAVIPILGTVAVIAGYTQGGPGSPAKLMALRPVQWLGDVSYSVYLWHWPLIALLPHVTGTRLTLTDKLAIIATSLILAGATKVWIEDRFRTPQWGRPLWKPYVLGAGLMAVVVIASTIQLAEVAEQQSEEIATIDEQAATNDCYGAASMALGPELCPQSEAPTMIPSPSFAKTDRSSVYDNDCRSERPYTNRPVCTYGDGPTRVALFGNSHAIHWLPALEEIAAEKGWTIDTYFAARCVPTYTKQKIATKGAPQGCLDYGLWVRDEILAGGYDLIITSNRQSVAAVGTPMSKSAPIYQDDFRQYLTDLSASGAPIMVIHDTPFPGQDVANIPDCLATHPTSVSTCAGTPESWDWYYPFYAAADDLPGVTRVDMTEYFCTDVSCPAVIGGVPTFFDGSHMTTSYSRSLAPYLLAKFDATGFGASGSS